MSFQGTRITPGSMQRFNPSDNLSNASKLFGNISTRIKGRAVSKLLGEYTPTGDMMADSNTLMRSLTTAGISPMEALGLTDKAMTPAYKQMAYDKGQYGFQTDDLGNAYSFNKNDGEYNQVANSPYGAGMINPKHIVMKPVTNTDSSGVSTTTQVPFNKMTGEVVEQPQVQVGEDVAMKYVADNYGITSMEQWSALPEITQQKIQSELVALKPNSGVGTKYPTIAQGDKGYADDMPAINNNLAELDKLIHNPVGNKYDEDTAFGAVDKWTGLVGSLFGTDDGVRQTEAKALISNLLAGFGKAQMAGVLTDQDMKIIKQQIPDVGDHPDVAKKKMKFIVRMMQDKNKAYIGRMNKSNPGFLGDKGKTYSSPDRPKPPVAPEPKEPYTLDDGTIVFSDGSAVKDGRRVQ